MKTGSRYRRVNRALTKAVALFALVALPLGLAGVATSAAGTVGAQFNGGTIDLSQGWGAAHACAVLSSTDIQCFSTGAELASFLTAQSGSAGASGTATGQVTPDDSCGTSDGQYLYFYQNQNYGGDELALANDGYWVNLSAFGFSDEMTSWINDTACNAYAAKGINGGGAHLTMPAYDYSPNVGSGWNDQAQSEIIA
jgi:hypothetical protein